MSQMIWNVEIDENTKLHVKSDGTAVIIRAESVKMSELPQEYLARVAEALNKAK